MKKTAFIVMAAALILLAAAAPALAHHAGGMWYKNNTCWNNQCFVSENGVCIYAENCPNGGICQNDCHFNCMKTAGDETIRTPAGGHMHDGNGPHHGRYR